jgi:hypothetical protein
LFISQDSLPSLISLSLGNMLLIVAENMGVNPLDPRDILNIPGISLEVFQYLHKNDINSDIYIFNPKILNSLNRPVSTGFNL